MRLSAKQWVVSLAFLLAFVSRVQAEEDQPEFNILSELAKLPACGLGCFINTTAQGTWCGYNATCICKDPEFYTLASDCIVASCESHDAHKVAKVEAQACNRPYRNRKHLLLIPLLVEIPSWLCPWIRLYSRWLTLGGWEMDDYVMLVVGILNSVFLVCGKYSGQLAFGVDMWNNEYGQIVQALKLFYVCESFYIVCLALCKASVVLFYLRIFTEKPFRIAAYVTMGLIVLPAVGMVFIQIFQCKPVNLVWFGWRLAYYRDRCMDIHVLVYAAAGISIFQDVLVVALPLPMIWRLNVDRRAWWGILVMFTLGIFVIITATVRLRYVALFGRSANPTWDYVEVLNWSGIELAVAIICASVPAIGALLKHLLIRIVKGRRGVYKGPSTVLSSRSGSNPTSRYLKSKGKEPGESQEELGLELSGRLNDPVGVETHVTRDRKMERDAAKNKAIGSLTGITVTRTVTTVTTSIDEPRR